MKLEIGGGSNFARGDGWVNLDQCPEADAVHNLNELPWPFADDTADEIYSSHCIEHVIDPHAFLRECARIGKVGCRVEVRCPWTYSDMAMTAGHCHVFSLQQARNMEFHFPKLTWGNNLKRPRFVESRLQPTERMAEAKAELPFLNGLSDQVIMKYIPGTAHDTVFQYVIQLNEFAM